MPRKTIHVEHLKKHVNDNLRLSEASPDNRQGRISLLEAMLHLTGNYKGFCYLKEDEVPAGQLPGIRTDNYVDGVVELDAFRNTDPTRVKYY